MFKVQTNNECRQAIDTLQASATESQPPTIFQNHQNKPTSVALASGGGSGHS